ncbi:MAG: TetR/AcrR family transcriptional regulator [Bradyrhizobiaceae bacterium]|nr:MAG: TetR/AcrR family transcriptional regulator [Bradyrhizobiaceae bacterium]
MRKTCVNKPIGKLTKRGAATRRRIVEGATELVLRNGTTGTSLDELMVEAGVSKSQIYHYFADKDAIVAEVIRRQVENAFASQSPHLRDINSMETLRHWCSAIVDLSRAQGGKGGCPIGSLASQLSDQSDHARRLLADSFESWGSQLESGLRRMRDQGELAKTADPHDLAVAILGAVQGGLLLAKTMRAVRPLELTVNMALALVERHLTPAGQSLDQSDGSRARELPRRQFGRLPNRSRSSNDLRRKNAPSKDV